MSELRRLAERIEAPDDRVKYVSECLDCCLGISVRATHQVTELVSIYLGSDYTSVKAALAVFPLGDTSPLRSLVGRLPENPIGYVYHAKGDASPRIKIGFSRKPKERRKQLENSGGQRIELLSLHPGTYLDEFVQHCIYRNQREFGEWFSPTPNALRNGTILEAL